MADDPKLAAALRQAKQTPMFFAFVAKGTTEGVLMVGKMKIPAKEINAANEVLSKLACQLDQQWPGRVVAVAWGPWAEVGMVADLEKHLVARGLKLIAPAVGAGFAVDEVIFGAKGETEVVVAGGTEHAGRPGKAAPAPAELAAAGVE